MAAGGLIGTAEDVARFGAAHFKPGFISKKLYEESFSADRAETRLAWRIEEDTRFGPSMTATGSLQGARAIIYVRPQAGLSLAMLTNLGDRPENIRSLARSVAHSVLTSGAHSGQ